MKLPNNPKVLAATYNPISNTKMINFLVDFPTVLLAELRTHRILTQGSLYEHMELDDFNMSANSARAIPSNKYRDKIIKNPFIPIWTKQQKGMSGEIIENTEELDDVWKWVAFGDSVGGIDTAYSDLIALGAHKQNANRLLAPFAWTTCIISGTEWDNFFELRCPKYTLTNHSPKKTVKVYNSRYAAEVAFGSELYQCARELGFEDVCEEFWQTINKSPAQPEFQVIAEMLYDLYKNANWKENECHIPFESEIDNLYQRDIDDMMFNTKQVDWKKIPDYDNISDRDILKMLVSASMCAKLSYNTQDNEDTLEKHLERASLLIEHKHQEPFSHQAVVMNENEYDMFTITKLVNPKYMNGNFNHINSLGGLQQIVEKGKCYNLTGFISQRYILENY